MAMTLLIGGARSGKSALALQIARRWGGPVTFIATAEGRDEEMRSRIEQHRVERDEAWTTVEEPVEIARAVADAPRDHLVILDCLTLWAANLMDRYIRDGEGRAKEAAAVSANRSSPTIVITNEVGAGIVPDNQMARVYRDLLGSINSLFAAYARDVLLLSAGRVLSMKHPEEVIDDVLGR
jgi:adenosyl cobinamide kinase/adenosyl cobinamide phosphate guanylyltransferase